MEIEDYNLLVKHDENYSRIPVSEAEIVPERDVINKGTEDERMSLGISSHHVVIEDKYRDKVEGKSSIIIEISSDTEIEEAKGIPDIQKHRLIDIDVDMLRDDYYYFTDIIPNYESEMKEKHLSVGIFSIEYIFKSCQQKEIKYN